MEAIGLEAEIVDLFEVEHCVCAPVADFYYLVYTIFDELTPFSLARW